jgi:hypothetical protein
MKLLAGTVKEGKVVLSGASLPEGTMVAVYAPEPGGPVHLPANLQAELEEAIAEADREDGISAEELFAQRNYSHPEPGAWAVGSLTR